MGHRIQVCVLIKREKIWWMLSYILSHSGISIHLCEGQNFFGTDQSNAIMFSSSAPCTACVSQRELLLAYEEKEKAKVGNAVAHQFESCRESHNKERALISVFRSLGFVNTSFHVQTGCTDTSLGVNISLYQKIFTFLHI